MLSALSVLGLLVPVRGVETPSVPPPVFPANRPARPAASGTDAKGALGSSLGSSGDRSGEIVGKDSAGGGGGDRSDINKMAEVLSFLKMARKAVENGNLKLADDLLQSIGSVELEGEPLKIAFREVAEVFEKMGQPVKAAAVYEKLISLKESDPDAPNWMMKVAEIYREMGAYSTAVSRYYSVINASIRLGGSEVESVKSLARKAQREIADTYFLKGDFEQAQKFYNMALRSDLNSEDRAMLLFRAGHCTLMRGDSGGAVTVFERFLKDFPEHASVPEARYMLASAFRAQGRPQEAYETVLELLRWTHGQKAKAPKVWTYWQKKAGNEFANDHYQRGEFVNALTLYQNVAQISKEPDWHWPVVYQMGLCFERLRMEPKARESYAYILQEAEKPEIKGKKLPENLANLIEMAKWRTDQMRWERGANTTLRGLAGPEARGGGKLK